MRDAIETMNELIAALDEVIAEGDVICTNLSRDRTVWSDLLRLLNRPGSERVYDFT